MTATEPTTEDRVAMTRRPEGRLVMRQDWDHLLFLHWEVPVESLRRLIPDGLDVDTFEGRAYVGLVPFTMRNVRPVGLPSVRGLSNFHETNVRTYVHAKGRGPGVWFFSLDAANIVGATLGRSWFRLPYFFARMSLKAEALAGGALRFSYASDRLYPGPKPATTRIVAEVSTLVIPAAVGTLEHFLAERYLLYAAKGSHLVKGRVHHSPYPLQVAEVSHCDETVVRAAGIDRPDSPPIAHYAQGVRVEVFGLESA